MTFLLFVSKKKRINFPHRAMSIGQFQVAGYKFRLYNKVFSVDKEGSPSFSLRIGSIPIGANANLEDLNIQVLSPTHATVQTKRQFMELVYYDDNYDPNGQIAISLKSDDPDEISTWSTLLNKVPREVIVAAVLILNGDDEAETFRVLVNNNDRNVNDPSLSNENVPVPGRPNNNGNNPFVNNQRGGRKRRRLTRKARQH